MKNTSPDGVGVRFVRGYDDVRELRSTWQALPGDAITADFDFVHAVLATRGEEAEPAVLVVEREERPVGMVIARIEPTALPLQIGYRRVYSPRFRTLNVVYRGLRGSVGGDESAAVTDELLRVLRETDVELVVLRRLDLAHPLYGATTARPSRVVRQLYTRVGVAWERSLPGSFDDFMASLSKSTRSGVRRYAKALEREFDGRLEVRRFTGIEDLDTYLRDADAVAATSYQRGLGVGVRNDEAQRLRTELSMQKGWFRAYVLYLDGTPVAFCGGDAYGGRFHYGIPGYDPAYRAHRVGTYVLMKMIEDLCADDSVHVLDFGAGDAEYKRRFGDRSWNEADVHLFRPRARPVFANVARAGILATNDGLKRVAGRAGAADRVKRRWRDRKRSEGAPTADDL